MIKQIQAKTLDICLLQRLQRDIVESGRSLNSILEQYQETVRPMYLQFSEPSKRYADIIVPRGGENRIAIEMIQAKMRELILFEVLPLSVSVESLAGVALANID